MFRFISQSSAPQVQLLINQTKVSVPEGTSVWAAMAQSGQRTTRLSPVTEKERSAYCAMGVCFECLVEIDGVPNRQACLTQVSEGMEINRQEITQNSIAHRDDSLSDKMQVSRIEGERVSDILAEQAIEIKGV